MPVHKYFCPECGLVLQSDTDVANQSVECLGCQTVFIAQPMNRPSAAESAVLRAPAPPPRKPKTDVLKPVVAPAPVPPPSTVKPADPPQPVAAPAARPSEARNPEPPVPAPAPSVESTPAEPPRRKTSPPPPPPSQPSSKSSVKLKRPAAPAEEDEEIISLAPVRKKNRWPLVGGLLAVLLLVAVGGATALWYFVSSGDSLKHRIEAPDKAWAFKLPDSPQTNEVKDDTKEYVYTRPGKDAEYTVSIHEIQAASPDEDLGVTAGLKFAEFATKYKFEALAANVPTADMGKYDEKYPRRYFEADAGSRGKLAVQLIVVNWSANKSTTIVQVAIGKDISDSDRKAFFNSVEIKKSAR